MSLSRFDAAVGGVAVLLISLTTLVIITSTRASLEIVRQIPVLYLQPDENSQNQLVIATPGSEEGPKQLTHTPFTVLDYAVSPDSSQIAFSAPVDEQGQLASANLWLINSDGSELRIGLNCIDAACHRPVWMPDGRRIIYERQDIPIPGALPEDPRLWWYDVFRGTTTPVFTDSQATGTSLSISADGKWLSFIGSAGQTVQLYQIEDHSTITVPNRTGFPATWHPHSQVIALADLIHDGELWSTALSTFNVYTQEYLPLTMGFEWDDINPVWSPDGEKIAFGRRQSGSALRSQIWVKQVESGVENPLTADTSFHHSYFTWSADSLTILYQRHDLNEQPGVWTIDLATGEKTEIAYPASVPAWLP